MKTYLYTDIIRMSNDLVEYAYKCIANYLLDFPTREMRDAFYENFKDLINETKGLL